VRHAWFGPLRPFKQELGNTRFDAYVSNVVPDGISQNSELLPHVDEVYYEHPLMAVSLYAMEVPRPNEGGDTIFFNAELAYERLPDATKERIAGLEAMQDREFGSYEFRSQMGMGDIRDRDRRASVRPIGSPKTWVHPVAFRHPRTGRTVLYVNELMTTCIVGLDADESESLLEELLTSLTDPAIQYRHQWKQDDLLIWDNWSLQHARGELLATSRRHMRRFTVDRPMVVAGSAT
jgi:taurine dioxygenase